MGEHHEGGALPSGSTGAAAARSGRGEMSGGAGIGSPGRAAPTASNDGGSTPHTLLAAVGGKKAAACGIHLTRDASTAAWDHWDVAKAMQLREMRTGRAARCATGQGGSKAAYLRDACPPGAARKSS
eukprot:6188311-Pleurochrysis_carterae.AAC.1